jgi:hypothetical protein
MFENRLFGRVFAPRKDEVAGGLRKLHREELLDFFFARCYPGDKIDKAEMGGECSPHGVMGAYKILVEN